jgi:hypothetical protein
MTQNAGDAVRAAKERLADAAGREKTMAEDYEEAMRRARLEMALKEERLKEHTRGHIACCRGFRWSAIGNLRGVRRPVHAGRARRSAAAVLLADMPPARDQQAGGRAASAEGERACARSRGDRPTPREPAGTRAPPLCLLRHLVHQDAAPAAILFEELQASSARFARGACR